MTRTMVLVGVAGSLLWAAGFGCGDDVSERRPSEMMAGWQGPPPRININVTGPDSDEGKREKCINIARENGIALDPSAPIQGTLILANNGNRLSIAVNGAPLREEPKPDWGMDQLCNDALLQLLSTARSAPQGGMAGGGYAAAPMATVVLTGPEADEGKRQRCNNVITRMGGSTDPNVAVRAVLSLAESGNSLQVISARRGVVFNQNKPGWGMEQLCQDAMSTAQSFLQQELAGGAPPPGYGQPPPGYGQPPGYAPPPPAYQPPPPQGGGWGFGIAIAGPDADDDKREKCQRTVAKYRGNPDSNSAAVTALLYLKDNGNTLQIVSKRRGIVSNTPKPGWSMDKLCEDAAQNAQMILQQEAAGAPPPMAPPPGAAAPPPSGAPPGTIAVSPMPASKGAPKNVADLAARGLADFGRRDYANALVAFAEAARSGGDAAMLFDTGLCYYMLHRPQEALQHLQLYIDRAPQAPNRQQADALIGDLHRQLGNDE
jgi:hypothetical protein